MNLKSKPLQTIWERVRSLGWIDLIGVCIFLGILSVAFFFFLRKADYAYITLRVSQSDNMNPYSDQAPVWFIEKIQPGLKETDGLGRDNVVIEKVHRFKSSDLNQDFYVDLKVRSVYNSRTKQFTYNGSTLLIGSYQSFKLQGIQLSGVIVDVREQDTPREEKTFLVEGYVNPAYNDEQYSVANTVVDGIKNYLADTLFTGLKTVDVDGQATAEIVSIQKRPARRQFVSGSSFVSVPDPERQRVEMTLRIKGVKINDAYYYKNEAPIVVNSTIYLTFPQSNINFTLTHFEEEKK